MDPKYEKELKRLRNSSDQERREHFGHVPWMDGYEVTEKPIKLPHDRFFVPGSFSEVNIRYYSSVQANEIIHNMMRVV